jgi:hypothetical protein
MSALVIPPPPDPIAEVAQEVPPPAPSDVIGFDPNTPPSTQVREANGLAAPSGNGWMGDLLSPVWSSSTCKKVVLNDFDRAAAYRQTNHESRWQQAAEDYLAFTSSQKNWPGTRIPRANMQIFLIFQQVEALIPQILDALTGNDLDFDVEAARAGTTISQCHLVRDVITYALRSLGGTNTRFLGWRECLRRMTKEGLIFGNGVSEWGWEGPYYVPEQKWARVQFPEFSAQTHWTGMTVYQPTGRMLSKPTPVQSQRLISQFFLDPCSLMDFYIDPGCRGPNVQEGNFCVRRHLMTVQQLDSMRHQEGFRIPSVDDLISLARMKQWTQGDTTRQAIAAANGENIQPLEDFSADPRLMKVEVLRWFSKTKSIWLVGREATISQSENRYAALPFSNWSYVDVPGAFYALSIPDICRTDQELAKALIDGRLDEVNLMLHPPTITKKGTFRTQSESRFRPGANWEAMNPKEDVIRMEMGNITQSAYVEVDSLENRVQKKTGVTDLAVLGTPSSGGNSANRTATGVQAQTNASNSRVHYLVGNFEDQTLQGLLEAMWQLHREFLSPEQLMEIVGPDGQSLMVDLVDLLNADPRFVLKTAQRMKQRAGLQGGGLNMLMQYVLNSEIGTLTEEQQGKVIDVEALSELFCDTYNVRAFNLFRPMTPQEQQSSQQRKQAPVQEKLAVQRDRLMAMAQQAQDRGEYELLKAIITGPLTALANAGALHNAMGLEAPVQLEARRLDAEIAGGQFEATNGE